MDSSSQATGIYHNYQHLLSSPIRLCHLPEFSRDDCSHFVFPDECQQCQHQHQWNQHQHQHLAPTSSLAIHCSQGGLWDVFLFFFFLFISFRSVLFCFVLFYFIFLSFLFVSFCFILFFCFFVFFFLFFSFLFFSCWFSMYIIHCVSSKLIAST